MAKDNSNRGASDKIRIIVPCLSDQVQFAATNTQSCPRPRSKGIHTTGCVRWAWLCNRKEARQQCRPKVRQLRNHDDGNRRRHGQGLQRVRLGCVCVCVVCFWRRSSSVRQAVTGCKRTRTEAGRGGLDTLNLALTCRHCVGFGCCSLICT